MINFKLKPEAGGDTVEITADSRDIYFWEKTYKGKSFGKLKSELMMEDLYALAFTAMRRQRNVAGTLGDFVEQYLLQFDQKQVTADADPTQPAASDEP